MKIFVQAILFLFASPMVASMHAQTAVPLQSFMRTGRTVQASIAGKTGTFLLDTGGGVTNITPEFATAIGCKPWGQISGYTMTGHRLDMKRCDNLALTFGGKVIPLETVGVFDGSSMMPPDAPHLDGTIALDAFAGRSIAFSYSAMTLALIDAATLAKMTRSQHALPLHLVRDAEGMALSVNFPVSTAGGVAWFELDSGNTSPFLLVGKHLASAFQLQADSKETQTLQATLTDGTAIRGDAKVLDLTLDGNLGTSFLARYDVVLDLAHAKAWLIPVKSLQTAVAPS